jgi:hypothetical protein
MKLKSPTSTPPSRKQSFKGSSGAGKGISPLHLSCPPLASVYPASMLPPPHPSTFKAQKNQQLFAGFVIFCYYYFHIFGSYKNI